MNRIRRNIGTCCSTKFPFVFVVLMSFLVLNSPLFAQQLPVFSTYSIADIYRNPAALIIPKNTDIQLYYSNSAPGFNDAPVSYFIGFSHPFKSKTYQGPSYSLNNNSVNNVKNAIGGYIAFDQYGVIQQLSAMIGYAQNFQLTDKLSFTLGLSSGIYNYRIDYSALIVKNQMDNTYARFVNQMQNFAYLDANLGLIVRYKDYKLETSFNQFAANKAQISSIEIDAELYSTYFYAISSKYSLNKNVDYIPELTLYHFEALPSWIGLKNYFVLDKLYLAGFIYNHKRNLGIDLGLIYQGIIFQYSFLINTSTFNVLGLTNHNFGFRYNINSKKDTRFSDYF